MLGLRQKVSGNPAWGAALREDDGLRWASRQIDRAVAAHELLRGGHVAIAGSEDFFDARHSFRAISKSRDGLRAADARDAPDSKDIGCGKQRGIRSRTNDLDIADARNFGRYHGHHQSGDESMLSARNVAANGFDRPHNLADFHAGFDFHRPRFRQLPLRDALDVACGMLQRAKNIAAHLFAGRANLPFSDPQSFDLKVDVI